MAIKVRNAEEISQEKIDKCLGDLDRLNSAVIKQIKIALLSIVDIDHIYDLREYIDDIIGKWEDEEIELEDEDDED